MPKKRRKQAARRAKKTRRKAVKRAKGTMRKTRHAVRKPARGKRVTKRTRKTAKKTPKARRAKTARKSKEPKPIGKVIHYYDRIGVGIVKLGSPLAVGERVLLRRGEEEFEQQISSMQIEHEPVTRAVKGAVIGLKVDRPVRKGAIVLPL